MLKRLGLWLLPIVYMAIIFHLSSEPHPLPQLTEHVWDKLLHTTEYAGLAMLVCRALLGEGVGWTTAILASAVFASFYSATDEFHQLFTPGRDSSVLDWFADTIGSSIGAVVYWILFSLVGGNVRALRSNAGSDQ